VLPPVLLKNKIILIITVSKVPNTTARFSCLIQFLKPQSYYSK
jgi:hypothetical protein